tara:strand:- start:424 stop:2172 length:1749 start_codon:yes stop_codon:yes gene_type:complete
MAVNYTIHNFPVAANAGETWGMQNVGIYATLASSQFDISLLGVLGTTMSSAADDGTVPLRMIITPNEGYVISASDLTIQEQEPQITISTPSTQFGNEDFFFLTSQANVDLRVWGPDMVTANPNIVEAVFMHDSGTPGTVGNYVVVYAALDPSYVIPEGSSYIWGGLTSSEGITAEDVLENIIEGVGIQVDNAVNIVLDIDGDAVLAETIPNTVDTTSNTWRLYFQMIDGSTGQLTEDSGITVIPFMADPFGIPAYNNNQDGWSWQSGSDSNGARAWFEFTPGANMTDADLDNQPLWVIPPNAFGMSSNSFQLNKWFWLVPKSGYTISRHNIRFSTPIQSFTDFIYQDIEYQVNNQVNLGTNGISDFPPDVKYPRAMALDENTNTPDDINITGGLYSTTRWSNPLVRLAGYTGGTGGSDYININDIQSTLQLPSEFTALGNIILTDITENAPSASEAAAALYFPGAYPNGFGYNVTNTITPPDSICPSDYEKNQAVLVSIYNMGNYIPGQNPPDITMYAYGGAWPNDGEDCIDSEVVISGSDCVDGFDSNGNPCEEDDDNNVIDVLNPGRGGGDFARGGGNIG